MPKHSASATKSVTVEGETPPQDYTWLIVVGAVAVSAVIAIALFK